MTESEGWQDVVMTWFDSPTIAAVGGSLTTGIVLLVQTRMARSERRSTRGEERAALRQGRARAAYREVSDALTDVVGAYDAMVNSAPEGDHGQAEFAPTVGSVDPSRFWNLQSAWNRALPELGETIAEGQLSIKRKARELDYMAESGMKDVFDDGHCLGEDVARFADAYSALRELEEAVQSQQARMARHIADLDD